MKIVIAGCGWLGKIVAGQLVKSGHEVWGSYRSSEAKEELSNLGIHPFYLDLNQENNDFSYLNDTDLLLVFFPPSSFQQEELAFSNLQKILDCIPETTRVIYSSSIGVYPRSSGMYDETFDTVNSPKPMLAKLEKEISTKQQATLILRLGGLIGPDRHPIFSLAGRQIESNGDSKPNLVDARDIARFIELSISNFTSGVYNFVAPTFQTKKEQYSSLAQKLNLNPIEFGTKEEEVRIISMEVFNRIYEFEFQFTPENWLFNRLE